MHTEAREEHDAVEISEMSWSEIIYILGLLAYMQAMPLNLLLISTAVNIVVLLWHLWWVR
jgi:hypothetical protein